MRTTIFPTAMKHQDACPPEWRIPDGFVPSAEGEGPHARRRWPASSIERFAAGCGHRGRALLLGARVSRKDEKPA
jgi:hypothetical protein